MTDIDEVMKKRPTGRPAGSGAQLPSKERLRQSRANLASSGGTRLDFSLDATSSGQLAKLMKHWDMNTRKQAVQHALNIIHQTINSKGHAVPDEFTRSSLFTAHNKDEPRKTTTSKGSNTK